MIPGLPPQLPTPKFGSGVIGKTSHVAITCVGAWGLILYRIGENWISNGSLIASGVIVTGFSVFYVKSSQTFAEKNPAQALLEGAPLVELRRAEMAVKGGSLPVTDPKELTSQTIIENGRDQDA